MKAEIRLNHGFYFPEVISQAVEDFKDACEIKIEKGTGESVVFLEKDVADEFCNYVLGLMKENFIKL